MIQPRGLVAQLFNYLSGYAFSSDYQADRAVIERVYRTYARRIAAAAPSRYFWRSICQYRCQATARATLRVVAANLVSVLILPFLVLLVRPSRASNARESCKYLKIDFHMAYQVPALIRSQTLERRVSGTYLTLADLFFVLGLFLRNRAFYPELLLKFTLWVASVRPALDTYDTEVLIQYCDYSAHSSLRKLFLNRRGVRLANISHGDEWISCRSAFASFDQYFAWHLTSKFIHDAMRIECGERFAFNPCEDSEPLPEVSGPLTFGCLWPSLDRVDLDVLVEQLNEISGFATVIVRPHPNPLNANRFEHYRHLLKAQVSEAQREDIHSFIERCGLMAGCLSSALLQAEFRGRRVIYFHDADLVSLLEYHDYYKKVGHVHVAHLAKRVKETAQLPESGSCGNWAKSIHGHDHHSVP